MTFQHAGRARILSAHRFALLAAGVQLGDGQVGEHGCDETICVRVDPAHVWVATQPQNLAHAVAIGRRRGPLPGKSTRAGAWPARWPFATRYTTGTTPIDSPPRWPGPARL